MEVGLVLYEGRVSQSRSRGHLCLSSRLFPRLLLHRNTHPSGLQTIHPTYHFPDGSRRLFFPYDFSLFHFVCRVSGDQEAFAVSLMSCNHAIKPLYPSVIQINRGVNGALSYLLWILQDSHNRRFSARHRWMFLLNEILPIVLCCANSTSQGCGDLKQGGHMFKPYHALRGKSNRDGSKTARLFLFFLSPRGRGQR